MLKHISAVAVALMLAAAAVSAGYAATEIAEPDGPVILEIAGNLAAVQGQPTDGEKTIRLDLTLLQQLPQRTIETYTDWTTGVQTFEGVLLKDLLVYVGAGGADIRAVALNDYAVHIPASDAEEFPVLLALKQNGKFMRIRDKGPIWIIYPADVAKSGPGKHNDRMVWQLRRLEIR
jgi:hypothetical protein